MPPAYFLNAPTAKVGKSARRNLRFLHLRARYILCELVIAYHTFTGDSFFRFDKRIASAPAPLPLTSMSNNASASTVATVSGSGAGRIGDASYATITTISCERVVKGYKFAMQSSVRGFLNRRFKWRFWVLLPPWAKVPRGRSHETPPSRRRREISHASLSGYTPAS